MNTEFNKLVGRAASLHEVLKEKLTHSTRVELEAKLDIITTEMADMANENGVVL